MQVHRNHYQILGVDKTATIDVIKKEYKKLALKHHPDKNPDDKEGAKKRFTKIAQAYSILSDTDKRAAYDRELDRPPFQPFQQGYQNQQFPNFETFRAHEMPQYQYQNENPDDIFNQFRKRQQFQREQQPRFRQQRTEIPQNMGFGMFEHNIKAPTFSRLNSFSGAFGSRFTFEMAEQIFNSAFQQPKSLQGPSSSSLHRAQSMREDHYQPVKEYVPRNSQLLSEKRIEKNGKQVLVKKYSITQKDGSSHTQTIQTILGKTSSRQQPTPPSSFHETRSSQPQQTNYDLFKKKSMNEKTNYGSNQPQKYTGKKGGISTLERLSSMRSTDKK